MGNLFSRSENDRLARLEEKLKNLQRLDLDGDGFVSKQEFDIWHQRQTDDLRLFKEELIKMKDREFQSQIADYEKQIKTLTDLNSKLQEQLHQQRIQKTTELDFNTTVSTSSEDVALKPFGDVSKAHINETIERLLANENVNIKYLPDFVERQLYRNVFNIALGLLEELINKTNIELLGHEITMNLAPKINETRPTEEEVQPEEK